MAKIIGGSSKYLYKKNFEYYLRSFGYYFLACFLFWFVIVFFGKNFYVYILLMLFVVFPLIYSLRKKSYYFVKRSKNYDVGISGEDTMMNELKKLDDSYTVFQNLHIPDKKANIDFVVIGPTGIFVIEAKNVHRGNILTKRYYIQETNEEFWGLHKYLNMTVHTSLFITPILAFTSHDGIYKLGFSPITNSIHAMTMSEVVSFVTSQPIQYRNVSDENLISAIRKITE